MKGTKKMTTDPKTIVEKFMGKTYLRQFYREQRESTQMFAIWCLYPPFSEFSEGAIPIVQEMIERKKQEISSYEPFLAILYIWENRLQDSYDLLKKLSEKEIAEDPYGNPKSIFEKIVYEVRHEPRNIKNESEVPAEFKEKLLAGDLEAHKTFWETLRAPVATNLSDDFDPEHLRSFWNTAQDLASLGYKKYQLLMSTYSILGDVLSSYTKALKWLEMAMQDVQRPPCPFEVK